MSQILQRTKYGTVAFFVPLAVHAKSHSATLASLKQEGIGTPSSGQVKTPASSKHVRTPPSASWKTPNLIREAVNDQGRTGRIQPLTCQAPPSLAKSGNPSTRPSLSTKTSEESTLFPEEEVCLSQARPSLETRADRGVGHVENALIPETLQETHGVEDDLSFPEVSEDKALPDTAVTEDGDDASLPTKDIVPETEMDSSEPPGTATATVQKAANPAASDFPNAKVYTQHGTGTQLTRRQAALLNTLCPSPSEEKGTPTEVAGAEGSRKVTVAKAGVRKVSLWQRRPVI
ncbi:hypothetical protein M758_UG096600 [Ceratodon purpureus]|nr:hypothetical protein M758_UG096600 [Ceratodon purpureus]